MASVYTILKCHDPGIQYERSKFIKDLHDFLRLEFQPENNISCTVKLQTELD